MPLLWRGRILPAVIGGDGNLSPLQGYGKTVRKGGGLRGSPSQVQNNPVRRKVLSDPSVTGSAASPASAGDLPLSRSEEHTSELQSRENLVCRLLLEKKKKKTNT